MAGLSEGNLRALQNPGTLLLLLAVRAGWRRYGAGLGELGTAGFTITALALIIVLVGNIVEFGLWGDGPLDSPDPGAAISFSGLLALTFGLVLLALAVMRSAWERTRRQRLAALTHPSPTEIADATTKRHEDGPPHRRRSLAPARSWDAAPRQTRQCPLSRG